jgi:hypothetical protein
MKIQRASKNVPKAPGTRFETRNCISEPGHQEPYGGIVLKNPVRLRGTRFKARNCNNETGPQEPYSDFL